MCHLPRSKQFLKHRRKGMPVPNCDHIIAKHAAYDAKRDTRVCCHRYIDHYLKFHVYLSALPSSLSLPFSLPYPAACRRSSRLDAGGTFR